MVILLERLLTKKWSELEGTKNRELFFLLKTEFLNPDDNFKTQDKFYPLFLKI